MLKICLATLRHEYRQSGEMESILNLQKYLGKQNIKADIITPSGPYVSEMRFSSRGIGVGMIFRLMTLYAELKRRAESYDVIHLFLPFPSLGFYGDLVKSGIPRHLIVTFEGSMVSLGEVSTVRLLESEPCSNFVRLLLNNRFLTRTARFRADRYIVSSRYQRRQLIPTYETVRVIPNLSDAERYKRIDPKEARKMYGLPSEKVVFSYLGHALANKGITDLMKAFSRLNCERAMLVFALSCIGRRDRMKETASQMGMLDKTIFFEDVDVSSFLSASDLLILPYRFSFGTNWIPSVILEALHTGTRVLTTNLAPLRELADKGAPLLFFEPNNPDDLIRAMRDFLEDRRKDPVADIRSHAYYKNWLDPGRVVERYITLYREVVGEENRLL